MPKFEIAVESKWIDLPRRKAAFWHALAVGRSLGLRVGSNGGCTWTARYRTTTGGYETKALGRAGSGNGGLSFQQAVAAANTWFSSAAVKDNAISPHEFRSGDRLIFSPSGQVFTVGHAFRDYVEWKRIAAAKSHFSIVVTMINHHLVSRIANIPLKEFLARDFHRLCIDVLETAPKFGNRRVAPARRIADLSPDELRRRKKTMNALTSIMRGAFTLAWENGELDNDKPIRFLKHLPSVDVPRSVFLSRAECTTLVEASRPDLRLLILGALYTGCRVQELANLLVRDVAKQGFGI